jgi:DNA primase
LWQAGLRNVTCSLGNHLNARQFQQLCDSSRTVYLAFDADANGSGARASQALSRRLWAHGVTARCVLLPDGHDPNSFLSRVAISISSAICWRQLVHEVLRG